MKKKRLRVLRQNQYEQKKEEKKRTHIDITQISSVQENAVELKKIPIGIRIITLNIVFFIVCRNLCSEHVCL